MPGHFSLLIRYLRPALNSFSLNQYKKKFIRRRKCEKAINYKEERRMINRNSRKIFSSAFSNVSSGNNQWNTQTSHKKNPASAITFFGIA